MSSKHKCFEQSPIAAQSAPVSITDLINIGVLFFEKLILKLLEHHKLVV